SRSARTAGVGNQIAGTRSRRDNSANTQESILSVLQASGASPLTFCASAISTCQPANSSWSCTNRAPFIDSIAAYTGPPNSAPIRETSAANPPASGSAVVTANGAPDSSITCTSSRVRLKSNPTCTMTTGLLPTRSPGQHQQACPRGEAPGFMTFIHGRTRLAVTVRTSEQAARQDGHDPRRTAAVRLGKCVGG